MHMASGLSFHFGCASPGSVLLSCAVTSCAMLPQPHGTGYPKYATMDAKVNWLNVWSCKGLVTLGTFLKALPFHKEESFKTAEVQTSTPLLSIVKNATGCEFWTRVYLEVRVQHT